MQKKNKEKTDKVQRKFSLLLSLSLGCEWTLLRRCVASTVSQLLDHEGPFVRLFLRCVPMILRGKTPTGFNMAMALGPAYSELVIKKMHLTKTRNFGRIRKFHCLISASLLNPATGSATEASICHELCLWELTYWYSEVPNIFTQPDCQP